jgi:hypothetical protein
VFATRSTSEASGLKHPGNAQTLLTSPGLLTFSVGTRRRRWWQSYKFRTGGRRYRDMSALTLARSLCGQYRKSSRGIRQVHLCRAHIAPIPSSFCCRSGQASGELPVLLAVGRHERRAEACRKEVRECQRLYAASDPLVRQIYLGFTQRWRKANVVVHPNDWRWGPQEHYSWREHEGRGYWRGDRWMER